MTEDHSDFLIKSAALLAKDLLVENRFLNNTNTTEPDSDDDLDLFFYSELMKKQKLFTKKKTHAGMVAKRGGTIALKRHSLKRDGLKKPPMNHLFLKFLQECEDITFENQFKMTRTTFQVRNFNCCKGYGPFHPIRFDIQVISKMNCHLASFAIII